MSEILLNRLKELAAKYDPDLNSEGYWESGNLDDAFEAGLQDGSNKVYGEIADILDELKNEK